MRKFVFALISIGLLTFYGCSLQQMMKMAKDQQLTVDPNPLEVHANLVEFEVSAVLPVKMLKPNLTYSLEMQYEYGDKAAKFDPIELNADDYPNADAQNPRMSETFTMPYTGEEMNRGELTVQGYGKHNKNGKTAGPTEKMTIAKGLITTSQMVKPVYYGAYVSYDYSDETVKGWTPDEELEPTHVNFYFLQGSSVLRWSEKRSDRGQFFQAFIAEKNVTRTVTITGTHSPEGPERINENLSENRASIIEDWYRTMMDKYDYKDAAEKINFILKPVVEDWTDFKEMLADYDGIDQAAKNQILSIINGSGTFEEKEDALHKLSSYSKIFRDIYPDLRSARTEILTVIEKRSDAEISVLAKQIAEGKIPADSLSYGELAYAAYLTPSVKEKIAIYEAAAKVYDHWACHNNLGSAYLQAAIEGTGNQNSMLDKASAQFDIANNKKKNAYSMGNMASVESMQGNHGKALESVSGAVAMDPPSKIVYGLNGVKGSLEIMKAEYDAAVRSLSNAMDSPDNMFNKGLAQILDKEYSNAVITFNELMSKDSDYAMAAYGVAIAEARQGKTDAAIGAIEDAVEIDPSLKSQIASDLEFDAMASSSGFINAVK